VVELAESIFHMPVSLGTPRNITGLAEIVRNPVYATAVGLLLYGYSREQSRTAPVTPTSSFMNRLKSWIGLDA
jgi:cell division protein FtsA